MRKRNCFYTAILTLGILLVACQPRVDLQKEKEEVLMAYNDLVNSLLTEDIDLLSSVQADTIHYVLDGYIEIIDLEKDMENKKGIFTGVDYEELKTLDEPIIHVSDDGTMAWLISSLNIKMSFPDSEGETMYREARDAFLLVFEKYEEGWRLVCNAQTIEQEKEENQESEEVE